MDTATRSRYPPQACSVASSRPMDRKRAAPLPCMIQTIQQEKNNQGTSLSFASNSSAFRAARRASLARPQAHGLLENLRALGLEEREDSHRQEHSGATPSHRA